MRKQTEVQLLLERPYAYLPGQAGSEWAPISNQVCIDFTAPDGASPSGQSGASCWGFLRPIYAPLYGCVAYV